MDMETFLMMLLPFMFLGMIETETKESETETDSESSTEKTDQQGETGEVEKTQDSEVEGFQEGDTIPFERFKKVIEERNTLRGSSGEKDALQSELEENKALLKNPSVFRAVLQAQGITDPKILNQKMQDAGFETATEVSEDDLIKEVTKGLDLKKQEDWFIAMKRMAKHFSDSAVKPLTKRFSDRESTDFISDQESKATELSKKFGIKYGQAGKDEDNPNTAVGVMWGYLTDHPEDAGLGHVKVLRLAMAEKGFVIGKQQGKMEEQERNEDLKNSAFEDDTQIAKGKRPTQESSINEIMSFARKNPDKI